MSLEKQTVYLKRFIEKDGLPNESDHYLTDLGMVWWNNHGKCFQYDESDEIHIPEWYLEEVEMVVMSEEELKAFADKIWNASTAKSLEPLTANGFTTVFNDLINQLPK
jgi:hypothetical protein